jgi:FMN-dependent NADH-azoreductase
MSLLRIDASIRTDGSASRELADIVEAEWRQTHPGERVIGRDLGLDPLPGDAWAHAVSAAGTPEAEQTPEQRTAAALATELLDELIAADAVLIAVPLYNFGVTQHIKTWIDLVLAVPSGGGAVAARLAGTPTVLVIVRGGAYGPGTPREGWDHSTGYLRRILEDVWGADLTVVEREFTLVGVNPTLDAFADQAAAFKDAAYTAARQAGRALRSDRAA